jgi:methylenetetrahydrofolate reductase (NADPH)
MSRLGFENVLALRGDPPQGQEEWTKTEGGLEYSRELVELISRDYQLLDRRGVLPRDAHPRHLAEDDLRYLKEKVDAGVGFLITQLFFDNALYYDFVARAARSASTSRSCPASCRSPARSSSRGSPRCAGPASPATCSGDRGAPREQGGGGRVRRRLRDDAVRRPAGQRRAGIHFYTLNRSRRRARSSAR